MKPGTHVNVVGSSGPGPVKIDQDLVVRSRYIADHREHVLVHGAEFLRAKQAGAVKDDHIAAEIGEVLSGAKPGRTAADEITLYKSLGHAVQDIAATASALRTRFMREPCSFARMSLQSSDLPAWLTVLPNPSRITPRRSTARPFLTAQQSEQTTLPDAAGKPAASLVTTAYCSSRIADKQPTGDVHFQRRTWRIILALHMHALGPKVSSPRTPTMFSRQSS